MTTIARLLFGLLLLAPPAFAGEAVDLKLVLAVDVSRSVDDVEAALQRQGYRGALVNPRVISAIQTGKVGAIAVTYIEWAGSEFQQTVVPWTRIANAQDAQAVSDIIGAAPRVSMSWTSISGAIDYARRAIKTSPFDSTRAVIDVSGDGRNNSGRPAEAARDAAVAEGITINGLPITVERPNFGRAAEVDLDGYYESAVIGGPGAFLIAANDFEAFGSAILSKLIREIAELPPQ